MDSFWNWLLAVVRHPFGIWDAIGFLGAAVFGARFIIQWLKSEMEGRSVAGAMINLVYVIHLESLPLALGNALPLFIYARNLYLTYRERAALAGTGRS
jgi:lipid-A-disaccharide synthase-like uncharacterized protein